MESRQALADARRRGRRFRVLALLTACFGLACVGLPIYPPSIDEAELSEELGYLCDPFGGFQGCPCLGMFNSEVECKAMADGSVGPAQAAGLVYSKSCMDGLVQRLFEFDGDADLCSPDAADFIQWLPCEDECQIYFGTAALGDPCERFGRRMSTCAADLACGFDDRCHAACDLPQVIPEGGPCGYAVGLLQEHCGDGLVCDEATATCVAPTMTGAACDPAAPTCAPADGCQPGSMTCQPRDPVGTPCTGHEQCMSGVCDGACAQPDPFACGNQYF